MSFLSISSSYRVLISDSPHSNDRNFSLLINHYRLRNSIFCSLYTCANRNVIIKMQEILKLILKLVKLYLTFAFLPISFFLRKSLLYDFRLC